MVDIGFVGKSLDLGDIDYGTFVLFYAWFLAPKVKYSLVADDFGFLMAERFFKGYSEEHKMIKLNEFLSLSEGKTISSRFLIDWTKSIERIKIPYRSQDDRNVKTKLFVVIVLKTVK